MFRNLAAAASADLCPISNPMPRSSQEPVQHSETVRLSGISSRLKVVCKFGQLHAHWACDCGSAGVVSPYGSVDTAIQAAYAAVGRHHVDRHASSPGSLTRA